MSCFQRQRFLTGSRLRESGKIVYVGEMKTPNPFMCLGNFIFLEVLQRNYDESVAASEVKLRQKVAARQIAHVHELNEQQR